VNKLVPRRKNEGLWLICWSIFQDRVKTEDTFLNLLWRTLARSRSQTCRRLCKATPTLDRSSSSTPTWQSTSRRCSRISRRGQWTSTNPYDYLNHKRKWKKKRIKWKRGGWWLGKVAYQLRPFNKQPIYIHRVMLGTVIRHQDKCSQSNPRRIRRGRYICKNRGDWCSFRRRTALSPALCTRRRPRTTQTRSVSCRRGRCTESPPKTHHKTELKLELSITFNIFSLNLSISFIAFSLKLSITFNDFLWL
jgi:hypothetical protein